VAIPNEMREQHDDDDDHRGDGDHGELLGELLQLFQN